MPINSKLNLAFVHIPRTGGTYIEHLIGVHQDRPDSGFKGSYNHFFDGVHIFGRSLQHLGFHDLVFLLGEDAPSYYWFTVIRNPHDRLQSIISHTLASPLALTSFAAFLRVCLKIIKIKLKQRLTFLRHGLFVGKRFAQINVMTPEEQHLMPQAAFMRGGGALWKTVDPTLSVFPFEAINALSTSIRGLDPEKVTGKPNASTDKSFPPLTIRYSIRMLTFWFYREDFKIYQAALSGWELGQPLKLQFSKPTNGHFSHKQ